MAKRKETNLQRIAIKKLEAVVGDKSKSIQQKLLEAGHTMNGEWICALCGRQFGKNLLGDRPFHLAKEHVDEYDPLNGGCKPL